VSKTTITIKNIIQKHDSPVIVVCGMTHGRPLPTVTIKWSVGLVPRGGNSVCFGYNSFLKSLLVRLALVNARTTIVPRFPTEHEDEWKVYLTTWDQHRHRKNRDCSWKLVQGSESSGALEYQWDHLDVWSYERHGSLETHGKYNLDCKYLNTICIIYFTHDALGRTVNKLRIPTTFRRGGLEITFTGKSTVRIAGEDEDKVWSKSTTANWQATIRITSEWNGLHVSLLDVVKPTFERTHTEGEVAVHMDTAQLLAANLPSVIDLHDVITELKSTLEGSYKYAVAGVCKYTMYSPAFNVHGDLILQLRPYDPSAKPPPPPPVLKPVESPASPTGVSHPRGPGPLARPAVGTKKRSRESHSIFNPFNHY
jgi:hypothetical protein